MRQSVYHDHIPHERVAEAAVQGDREAREALVSGYLPLVYNVVGRAAESDLDVDDIVQETMLRIITGLPAVRQLESLRSWIVAICLRQLSEARRQARSQRLHLAPPLAEQADPAADFVALLILRESLSQEQREVAEAARWLDPGFRDLLSLWWLEASGHLDRAELAASLGESPAKVAVRVQRMKAQLDVARSIVRVLGAEARCPGLAAASAEAEPSPLLRKRIARHLRECPACAGRTERLVPLARLLAGLPLALPPARLGSSTAGLSPAAATAGPSPATGGPHRASGHGTLPHGAGRITLLSGTAGKVAVSAAAVVLLAGLGTAVASTRGAGPSRPSATGTHQVQRTSSPRTHSASPVPAVSAPVSRPAVQPRPTTPSAAASATTPVFSSVVPPLPQVQAVTVSRLTQNSRVAGRDNGQSTGYGNRSVWVFDDTTLKNPWGFLSNSGAVTTDLDATDGITLTSGNPFTVNPAQTPVNLLPLTAPERAFEAAHSGAGGCAGSRDQYCGAVFGFWPGPTIADPKHHRVLVFYGKLCRGGAAGTPCSGPLGRGLGGGIAALDMDTGTVTRLVAANGPKVSSVEGLDPTAFFGPDQVFSAASLVVGDTAYTYGDCTGYGCKLGRVPLAGITDRSQWRFYTGGGKWSADPGAGTHVIAPGAAGQTVFYDPALRAFVNVYMPFGSNAVMYQVGGSPFGPWSAARTALQTPGGRNNNYALFAHPEYARQNGLVEYLTYFQPDSGAQQLVRLKFHAR
ncbi:sigma-70 family RNA polymerase sigma factor [Streptacidiphilus sp. PAMC 29251]